MIADRCVFVGHGFDDFLSQNSAQYRSRGTEFAKYHPEKIHSNITMKQRISLPIKNSIATLTRMHCCQLFGCPVSFRVGCDPGFHTILQCLTYGLQLLDRVSFESGTPANLWQMSGNVINAPKLLELTFSKFVLFIMMKWLLIRCQLLLLS